MKKDDVDSYLEFIRKSTTTVIVNNLGHAIEDKQILLTLPVQRNDKGGLPPNHPSELQEKKITK